MGERLSGRAESNRTAVARRCEAGEAKFAGRTGPGEGEREHGETGVLAEVNRKKGMGTRILLGFQDHTVCISG